MASTSATPIQLPVIDIADPLNPAIGKDMLDAAIKYGFFYVHGKGSDFTAAEVDSTFALVNTFHFLYTFEIKSDCNCWLTLIHSKVEKVLRVAKRGKREMSH